MTSGYAHVMDRSAPLPLPSALDPLQVKKKFSVSHLLDLEEAAGDGTADGTGAHAEESGAEAGRSLLESPGLSSGARPGSTTTPSSD
ncbi:hypothetical protein WMY93_033618 [Mugilogobius chulae]|uniref:Uncharacterized protein n=1 Tax=Mugilogobius chulae TaxID=88201 RepID=A0AAW0MHP2_9GOBI